MSKYLVENLKKFKKESKLSNAKLSQSLGVHQNSLGNWLTGKFKPSKLARAKIRELLINNL